MFFYEFKANEKLECLTIVFMYMYKILYQWNIVTLSLYRDRDIVRKFMLITQDKLICSLYYN